MLTYLKNKAYKSLRQSEKYTKTDMVYLAKGGFWLTIGKIVSTVMAFTLAIVYANFLPKNTYATYKYILSIGGIISIATLPGMNTSLIRSIALGFEGSIKDAVKTKLKWSILGLIAGLGISFYYLLNNNLTLGVSFLIASFSVPLIDGYIVYGSYLQGKKYFKTSAIYTSINQITLGLAILSTIFFSKNIILLITVYYFTTLFILLCFSFLTFKNADLNDKKDTRMISFGKHLSLMSILGIISAHIDKILMWHFLGPIELAIYSFAILPVMQAENFIRPIATMAFPKLAEQKLKVIKKTLPIKIFKFMVALIPFVFIYILIAPYVYKIAFREYTDSIIYSQIFAFVILFFPQRLFSTSLTAHAQKKALYLIKTIEPSIKIILMITLIPLYGIGGAILALMLSIILSGLLSQYFLRKTG